MILRSAIKIMCMIIHHNKQKSHGQSCRANTCSTSHDPPFRNKKNTKKLETEEKIQMPAFDVQHSPFTTVGEALWISARLRFDKTVSDATVKLFIQEIEELVELVTLRGSLVGMPGKDGLSVEQRKRLTIAVELVANPSVIFMDVSSICNIKLYHTLHNADVLYMCTTLTWAASFMEFLNPFHFPRWTCRSYSCCMNWVSERFIKDGILVHMFILITFPLHCWSVLSSFLLLIISIQLSNEWIKLIWSKVTCRVGITVQEPTSGLDARAAAIVMRWAPTFMCYVLFLLCYVLFLLSLYLSTCSDKIDFYRPLDHLFGKHNPTPSWCLN